MEIIRLEGTDRKLYEWVAPLVMNPAILRQNNNYPFKTSHRHIWYLAVEGESVMGFMPLKPMAAELCIDNYYVSGDSPVTIAALLARIAEEESGAHVLTALVHKRHVEMFRKQGFQTVREWKNYDKMKHIPLGL